ncbi:MAG TPA: serine hydrolase domain-containing protein [Amycolatopsis sp.]|nr:serine hydrolase domain-containing protein [Amycolatopsis sp.]
MALSRRQVLSQGTAAAVLAVGGWSLATPMASASQMSSVDKALLDAMRRLHETPGGPPAIIVAFGRGSHTVGVADLRGHRPPKVTDHTRLASVAKAFSGATALALVARGRLSLDDTIGRWLDGLPREWSRVTLSQLLGHTSGVPDFSDTGKFRTALFAALQNPPPHRVLLTYVDAPELEFTPGSRYSYSNTDNILVALMCEAAAGGSYEDVLRKRVLDPLGLGETSLPNGSAMPAPFVHGYDVGEQPPEDVSTLVAAGWSWASGGVVSTPADTVRFIRGYVRGDTTNRAAQRAQFQFRPGSSEPPGPGVTNPTKSRRTPSSTKPLLRKPDSRGCGRISNERHSNSAGLALFRYDTRYGRVFGHTGNTAGYTQFTAATQDGSRAVAVTASAQITPTTNAHLFPQLREIFELAVGAALNRHGDPA